MSLGAIGAVLVLGAALELLGLGLVAWDVWDARRQRDALARQDQLVQVGPGLEHERALGGIVVQGGGAPPPVPRLEERVAGIEGDIADLRARLDAEAERQVQAHRALDDRFGARFAELQREVFDLGQRLRPVIGAAAAGKVWRRALGVGLFAIGLILQTVANVVAL